MSNTFSLEQQSKFSAKCREDFIKDSIKFINGSRNETVKRRRIAIIRKELSEEISSGWIDANDENLIINQITN